MSNHCVVCGARLRMSTADICDSVCSRARANGRSRYAQLTAEAKALPYPEKRNDSRDMDRPFPNIGGQ